MKQQTSEFYIGWQADAPQGISRQVRRFVIAISIIVPLVSAILVMNQNGFGTSTFEYGIPTEIEGIFTNTPAPFLQVQHGTDINGMDMDQHILLVAPGKHGIQEMLKSIEATLGYSLEGRMVRMKGFLIYHDGKTLMEVEDMTDIVETGTANAIPNVPTPYGQGSLIGEITDPKCLFGVMKPGYGKPHRSCAARCIAGGIPPVLKTIAADGSVQYYLLAGDDGTAITKEVLPFVGDYVGICGEIQKVGDWHILYRDPTREIALMNKALTKDLALCKQ